MTKAERLGLIERTNKSIKEMFFTLIDFGTEFYDEETNSIKYQTEHEAFIGKGLKDAFDMVMKVSYGDMTFDEETIKSVVESIILPICITNEEN